MSKGKDLGIQIDIADEEKEHFHRTMNDMGDHRGGSYDQGKAWI